MALKDPTGKRFGKNTGSLTKKKTTNANELIPDLREDVVKSSKEDAGRIKRGLAPAKNEGATRKAPQFAAGRALLRTATRGSALGGAFMSGKDIGDALVDRYVEDLSKGKVKLSDYAKKRLKEEEDFQEMQKAMKETQPEKKKSQTQSERFRARSEEFTSNRKDGYAKGGMTKKRK